MIPFIFVAIFLAFFFLVLSFAMKNYPLVMISAMSLMILGVSILSDNIEDINNLLTLTLGVVCVCIGAYVFINGSLEKLQEYDYGGTKW
ncbi:hypothetical protein LCGC14_2577340 [marine sediment metagenome]|uniref:Citrate transporter-like domain-containing protein n=1 Tax=marine sediment metagenome TaxID=412755 RepID=A0A0F9CRP1_9ZZZZ